MIREYKEQDLNILLEVWYAASQVGHPFLDEAFFEKERQDIAALYLPNSETWVYQQNGAVVGFIALVENEVGAIFVDPPLHGQGIGRALMDQAKHLKGDLEVEVFKKNQIGRKFYQQYGFRQINEYFHEETGHMMLRLSYKSGKVV